jgi:hypothetical protein
MKASDLSHSVKAADLPFSTIIWYEISAKTRQGESGWLAKMLVEFACGAPQHLKQVIYILRNCYLSAL